MENEYCACGIGLAVFLLCQTPSAHANLLKPLHASRKRESGQSYGLQQQRLRSSGGRTLLQQQANQFSACPMTDYVYSGPTMDSIFDELSVEESQRAVEYIVSLPNPGLNRSPLIADTQAHSVPDIKYKTSQNQTKVAVYVVI